VGSPITPDNQEEYEHELSAIRAALGEEAFAAAWEAGRALSWEQAIAYALEEEPAQ
jgi:hypothetical protein